MADNKNRAPEQRTVDVDVEAIDTRGRTLHGYAAVYNVESEDLGGFKERIAPGAFRSVLDADVRALLNHDPSQVLGPTRSGTLRLFDEQRGLRFEVDLPDSPLGENVREAVRRRDIDGASFRFCVDQESWDRDLRTIESVRELKDVTVATFGAYPAASVELRTRNNDGARERQEEVQMEVEKTEERSEERPSAGSLRIEDRTVDVDIRFQSLAELVRDRGFGLEDRSAAVVNYDEFRSFTWAAGTVLTGVNPIRREGVGLGYDRRYLYPVLPTTAVDSATTAVQYLRQSSRGLAGTATIRHLASTSTKPETSTTAELATLEFSQVATINPGVPRIHAQQAAFASYVESDLRLSISDGLDEVVRRGVVTAGTASTVTGDILQKTRRAMTVIEAAGYAPNVLAIDAAGAESLDLLRSAGSEQFYLWGPGQGAPGGPFGLELRVWKAAGTAVLDANAFGRFYVAPIELRSFEENAGATNTLTVRAETHAGYAVERPTAGLRVLSCARSRSASRRRVRRSGSGNATAGRHGKSASAGICRRRPRCPNRPTARRTSAASAKRRERTKAKRPKCVRWGATVSLSNASYCSRPECRRESKGCRNELATEGRTACRGPNRSSRTWRCRSTMTMQGRG
jgi:uncharacterized protein